MPKQALVQLKHCVSIYAAVGLNNAKNECRPPMGVYTTHHPAHALFMLLVHCPDKVKSRHISISTHIGEINLLQLVASS